MSKLTESARGEQCTLRIAGVCNYDPATTVWAHLPDETHGMALKSNDLCGCYACSACHDAIDKRSDWFRKMVKSEGDTFAQKEREFYMRRGLQRTLVRLHSTSRLRVE